MKMKNQLKDRLEVGDELFFYDQKTILEKTRVVSVDKKAKTALLENRVIISRYPENTGNFKVIGKNTGHLVLILNEDLEMIHSAHISRRKIETYMNTLNTIFRNNKNLMEMGKVDMELLIKVHKRLSKVSEEYRANNPSKPFKV